MTTTTQSTLSSAIQTKFERRLKEKAKGRGVLEKFAKIRTVAKGEGKTVRLNQILRLDKVTSAHTEGATISSPKAFTSDYREATVTQYADAVEFSDLAKLNSIVSDDDFMSEVADQVVRSREYYLHKLLAQGGLRHRVDNDSTYEVNGTADSGTTTTLVDDALTQADNFFGTDTSNFGFVTIVNPGAPNYDMTSKVTDFVASSDTATVSFPQAISSSCKYHMVIPTGIVSTDKLTIAAITRVAGLLELLQAKKFNGGIFRAVIHPGQHADLYSDTTYQNIMIYDKSEAIGDYTLFRLLNFEHLVSDEIYREDEDGSENQSTGVSHVAQYFGADAYSFIKWGADGDTFGVNTFIINQPDSGNLVNSKSWFSWKCSFAGLVDRATNIVGLMTGATAQPVVV